MEQNVEYGVNSYRGSTSSYPLQSFPATETSENPSILLPSTDIVEGHRQNSTLLGDTSSLDLNLPTFAPISAFHPFELPPLPNESSYLSGQTPEYYSEFELFEDDEFSEFSALPEEMPRRHFPFMLELSGLQTQVTQQSVKRQAESPTAGRPSKAMRTCSSQHTESKPGTNNQDEDLIDVVDLRDIENEVQWQEIRAKEAADAIRIQNQEDASRPMKLADFQCIICMDSPTNLTVTHCGHLFCSECLHQALYAGDKKCCPVCRTVISLPKAWGRQVKNGVFALEMKLMTATKKGKQALRAH